jgi:hypothetical protein
MSVEELSRLGDEILQLATQNQLCEDIAQDTLAELHAYFVERADGPIPDLSWEQLSQNPPQLHIPGVPQYSVQPNPVHQQGGYAAIPGVPIPAPPLGNPPPNYQFWASPYYHP